jgi:hypothetical protein
MKRFLAFGALAAGLALPAAEPPEAVSREYSFFNPGAESPPEAHSREHSFYNAPADGPLEAHSREYSVLGNLAPVAGADAFERRPGHGLKLRPAALLANDADPEGGPLALTGVTATSAAGASVALDEDWIVYEAVGLNPDTDTFAYTVADIWGAASVGVVTVTLAGAGPGPTFNVAAIIPQPDGSKLLRGAGLPGRAYEVQAATNLGVADWVTLGTVVASPLGLWEQADPDAGAYPVRFYRAVQP